MDMNQSSALVYKLTSAASVPPPNQAGNCVRSGLSLLHDGFLDAATKQFELALMADPSSRQAHAGLYYALSGLGKTHPAASHLARALQLQAVITLPYHGAESPVSVVLLLSIHAGNVLIQRFLNDRIFRTHIVIVEFYEDWMPLPQHDAVINGIGDADVRAEALSAAERIIARSAAPVLNRPAAVRETGRCRNAERLSGIPGVITPRTATLSRSTLTACHATADLAIHGFDFPILLRAPGLHMGRHFARVERPDDLADGLRRLPGDDFIVIQYLNARGDDGLVRKYRVLFVDGRIYPVHAAVSSHWKVHYFSAEMATHRERRAEDAAFLTDMEGLLGSQTVTTLGRVQDTLGLDYGGIDFGLSKKSEVLLFEANATMAVSWPGPDACWDYRRPVVERIYAAVQQMLMSRVRHPD